jgi:hypothetical protein
MTHWLFWLITWKWGYGDQPQWHCCLHVHLTTKNHPLNFNRLLSLHAGFCTYLPKEHLPYISIENRAHVLDHCEAQLTGAIEFEQNQKRSDTLERFKGVLEEFDEVE